MSVDVRVDLSVYPLESVMGSAYVFVDRCYVLLDKADETRILVSLSPKPGLSDAELNALAGEFQNELLSQALRRRIGQRHERMRELLLARALFGAAPRLDEAADPASADLGPEGLDAAELGDDFLDDPLGIAVPWEEKFGRPAGEAAPAAPAPEPPAATAAPSSAPVAAPARDPAPPPPDEAAAGSGGPPSKQPPTGTTGAGAESPSR